MNEDNRTYNGTKFTTRVYEGDMKTYVTFKGEQVHSDNVKDILKMVAEERKIRGKIYVELDLDSDGEELTFKVM